MGDNIFARKRLLALAVTAVLFTARPDAARACSSFADYRGKPIYGMNFDYPETEWRFMIYKTDQGKVLSLEFRDGKDWIPTASLNDKGLFVATQLELPSRQPKAPMAKGEERIGDIGRWIIDARSADEILARADAVRLVDGIPTLHHLFAGIDGAAIMEVGNGGNYARRSEGEGFLAMTNFALSKFDGVKPESAYGAGADRYQKLTRDLVAAPRGIDSTAAMLALSRVAVSAGSYPTLCTMVVDPSALTVTVAVSRDWEKTWTVSLRDGTIEPNWAPDGAKPIRFGKNGVTSRDLSAWTAGEKNDTPGDWIESIPAHPAGIALALMAAAIVFAGLRFARRRWSKKD
jgi:hypothetical protein